MPHETPQPLVEILNAIQAETAKLTAAAANLDVIRKFTLDGRLVGDIGEMLAAQHLELTLDDAQRRGHDAFTTIAGSKRDVQIKCRKASTRIEFSSVPDMLVVIEFSDGWKKWDIVYNGPGTPIRDQALNAGLEVDLEGRIRSGGRRDSIDLLLNWFRSDDLNQYRTTPVPARLQPLQIFTTA
jgi:hypothetical protein